MAIWRYKLTSPFVLEHPVLLGIHYENEWVKIHNGRIRIEPGYAWDGCTPSFYLGFWFGTPPLIYLPMCGNNAGKNSGTGGDFVVNGTITDGGQL